MCKGEAVCCSVLQCAAVCCSVLQCVAVRCSALQCIAVYCIVLQCVAVCCSVFQCVPAWRRRSEQGKERALYYRSFFQDFFLHYMALLEENEFCIIGLFVTARQSVQCTARSLFFWWKEPYIIGLFLWKEPYIKGLFVMEK